MNKIMTRAAALALLAGGAAAQQSSLSATIVQELEVRALGYWPWGILLEDTEPVGPFPAGGVELFVRTDVSNSGMGAGELTGLPAGVAGFRWSTGGAGPPGEFGGYAAFGGIELRLSRPKRTPVLVVVEGEASSLGTASTVTTVDVDGDQVVDLWLDGGRARIEHGLLVGPEGSAIELQHWSGGAGGSSTSDLTLTAYPGNAPLASYGTSCLPLTWTRGPTGAATLSCPATSGLVVFFFGTRELHVPLSSGCFLLTNPGRKVLVRPTGGMATLELPDLAPAQGEELRVQAAVIAARGVMQTTNGLVMTGP